MQKYAKQGSEIEGRTIQAVRSRRFITFWQIYTDVLTFALMYEIEMSKNGLTKLCCTSSYKLKPWFTVYLGYHWRLQVNVLILDHPRTGDGNITIIGTILTKPLPTACGNRHTTGNRCRPLTCHMPLIILLHRSTPETHDDDSQTADSYKSHLEPIKSYKILNAKP